MNQLPPIIDILLQPLANYAASAPEAAEAAEAAEATELPLPPIVSEIQFECPQCHQTIGIQDFITHMLHEHPLFFRIWFDYSYGNASGSGSDDDYETLLNLCETIGNEPVGVHDLETEVPILAPEDAAAAAAAAERCTICLESIDANDANSATVYRKIKGCGHIFCAECIEQWLAEHHQCPLCKYEIPSQSGVSFLDSVD